MNWPRPEVLGLFPAERLVMIGGPIDDTRVAEVTPRILRLRAESSEPIGVVIHSPGGSIQALDQLESLLGLDDPPDHRPPVVTFTAGTAASAAAMLLTGGDVAAALPSASVFFHGVRTRDDEITEERSREHEGTLHEGNSGIATALARRMFPRMIDTLTRLPEPGLERKAVAADLQSRLADPANPGAQAVARLAAALLSELDGGANRFAEGAWDDLVLLQSLRKECERSAHRPSRGLLAALRERDETDRVAVEHTLRVLNVLIAWLLKSRPEIELDHDDIRHIAGELDFYAAWSCRSFQDELLHAMVHHGESFFAPEEWATVQRTATRGDGASETEVRTFDAVLEQVYRRAEPLWAFCLGIARGLVREEAELSPYEAWWLGLIDVVVGTELDRRVAVGRA
jgi:hypothetical protein